MIEKQKYVKLKEYNSIIIFSPLIPHNNFRHMGVVSAGFCYVNAKDETVNCFGESIGLGLKSDEYEDSRWATFQIFGTDAASKIVNTKNVSK
jgi:hypothetical protein